MNIIKKYNSIYNIMNLSDFNVVKLLIQFRDRYDRYFLINTNNNCFLAGDEMKFDDSMINIFIYLDDLINKCNFNEEQKAIIKLLQMGYTYREIAESLGKDNVDNIRRRFNKICRDIVEMNNRVWRKYVYINKLNLKTKICGKCKEELPAIDEFFSPDDRNNDGFHSFCKFCR